MCIVKSVYGARVWFLSAATHTHCYIPQAQHTNESIDAELNSQRRDAEGLRRALNRMEGENRGLKAQNNALLDAQADVCSKCGSELGLQNDGDTTDIIAKQHSRIADLEVREREPADAETKQPPITMMAALVALCCCCCRHASRT